MRDAIVLSDLAADTANRMREMFNNIGALQGEAIFEDMTEEEIVAACIYFMDMTLRNPMTVLSPLTLASMRACLNLATNQDDETSEILRQAMGRKGHGDAS